MPKYTFHEIGFDEHIVRADGVTIGKIVKGTKFEQYNDDLDLDQQNTIWRLFRNKYFDERIKGRL